MDTRFHCVYLLTSLDPLCQGEYYIGYTVNPVRRLRQHNGELVNGARRTSRRGRPWTMVCCVSGFVEDRAALKFEWCWQHPHESARIKHLPQFITLFMRQPNRQYRGMTRRDVSFAVAILHLLLRATLFSRLDLTLHVLDRLRFDHAVGEAQTRIKLLHRVSHPVAGETSSARGMCATDPTSPHVVLCESSSVLPSLTESDLFHVEEIDLHGFEEKYLSHDRCLSMDETWAMLGQTRCPDISANASTTNNQTPLAGTPNTSSVRTLRKEQSGLARGTYTDADKSCFGALSCVYDIKALSQNIREEWPEEEDTQQLPPAKTSSARWEDEEVCVSDTDTPKMSKTMIETDQSGPCGFVDGAHVAAVPGEAEHSLTHYEHDAADGDANHNEEDELTLVGGATQLCSPSYASRPCATRSISPVPLSTQAVCTSSHLPQRRYVPGRIPLRFRYYTELDYARLHKLECKLMRVKLLPCTLCGLPLQAPYIIRCPREPHCSLRTHIVCLAMWFHYEHDQARRDRDMVDECAPATKQSDRADNGNKGTDCNGCDDGSDDNSDNSSDSSCPSSDDEAHIKYPKTDNRSCDNGLQTSSRTTAKTNAATTNMGGDADSHKHNDLLAAADADTCNGHGRSTILYPPVPHVDLIPTHPCPCPLCHEKLLWPCLVRALKQRVGKERRAQAVQRRALMEQRLQQRLQSLTTGSAASPKRAKRRRENENDGTTDRSSLPLRLPAIEANKVATAPAPSVRSASPITHRGQIRRRKQVREGGESPLREHGAVFPLEESSQTMPLGTCATVDDHAKQASKRYTRAGYYAGTTTETFRADTNNSFTALQPQSNSENSTTMLLGLTEFNEEEWLNM